MLEWAIELQASLAAKCVENAYVCCCAKRCFIHHETLVLRTCIQASHANSRPTKLGSMMLKSNASEDDKYHRWVNKSFITLPMSLELPDTRLSREKKSSENGALLTTSTYMIFSFWPCCPRASKRKASIDVRETMRLLVFLLHTANSELPPVERGTRRTS